MASEDALPSTTESTPPPAPEGKKGWSRRLYDYCLKWAGTPYALPALCVMSFAESSFFPLPPDALLLPMCFAKPKRSFVYATACVLASVLGGILGYYIGYALWGQVSHWFIPRIFSQAAFDKVASMYVGNAFLIIAAKGLTPIPFKIVTITAGVVKIPFGEFVAASIVCRGIRFYAEATLIFFFGEKVRPIVEKYLTALMFAAFVLLVGGFVLIKMYR